MGSLLMRAPATTSTHCLRSALPMLFRQEGHGYALG